MAKKIEERETALVARWAAHAYAGRWLRTVTGERLAVLFPGRPGGPAGPDFRDAVLLRPDGSRIFGDVELHLRARGWHEHGHARDRRYDRVVLHVVRQAQGACATPLASGGWAPLVELEVSREHSPDAGARVAPWPCAGLAQRLTPGELGRRLRAAGCARLEERAKTFETALLHLDGSLRGNSGWPAADGTLFVALAEGLAYGRERQPLCEAGRWLASEHAPERLLSTLARLPQLDARRMEGLLSLYERWRVSGPWQPLRSALTCGTAREGARALIEGLAVADGLVSPGRAAILAANVVLPFALAVAERFGDALLARRARAVYAALPGLPSNQITRAMQRQLGLARAPAGACAQQGLQHMWAHWCREKRCQGCVCASGE